MNGMTSMESCGTLS